MAMKKKFLGLAMAAAIAIPATSVYATGTTGTTQDTQTIESEANSKDVTVPVTGTVTNKQGEAPQKIEVELPSKMAFAVDKDGHVAETNYTIRNNSKNVDISLSVGSFTGGLTSADGSGDGIQIIPGTELASETTNHYRNQVSLTLSNGAKEVDLANYKTQSDLGKIEAGRNTVLKLKGKAGTKQSNSTGQVVQGATDVDSKGASDEFELVFSITKAPN